MNLSNDTRYQTVTNFQSIGLHLNLGVLSQPKILIVEDDPDMSAYYRKILAKNFGINEVDIATTVDEAFWYFEKKHFDFVISDIVLPNLRSGIDLWSHIRPNLKTKVIFISAVPADEYVLFFDKGVNPPPFLHKPFATIDCQNILGEFFQKKSR